MKHLLLRLRTQTILFSIILSMGCAATRFAQWGDGLKAVDPQNLEEARRLEREGDVLFTTQDVKENLYYALVKWRVASQFSPSKELFLKLARGHFSLAKPGSIKDYEAALAYSEKAMALFEPSFVERLKGGVSFEKAVKEVQKPSASALLIYANSLQKWCKEKGLLTLWRYQKDVSAAKARALELGITESFDGQVPDSGEQITR